jgi:hypothetical protein
MATRRQIAKLTEYVFDKLSTTEYHPIDWRTAIYAGLLEGNNDGDINYKYGEHNTWILDHQWRGNKRNQQNLYECNCDIDFNENLTFHCTFLNQNEDFVIEDINLNINDFNEALWLTIGENSRKILNSADERAFLFKSILKVFIKINEDFAENSAIIYEINIDESIPENLIHQKIISIHQLYLSMHNTYNNNVLNEKDKTFFQTVLGAAIYYLPHPERCWNRRISLNVINHVLEGGNKVKDHIIPRKLAAKNLLELANPSSLNEFDTVYWEVYSKFTYVTTNENYQLRNYYNNGLTYDKAANEIGILWFDKLINHLELRNFMKYLIDKNLDNLNIIELSRQLEIFRI